MRVKLGICLQTCGREDYTARTLQSFAFHNSMTYFLLPDDLEIYLYHQGDGENSLGNYRLAKHYGFETIDQGRDQLGIFKRRQKITHDLSERGMTHILVLENDWVSTRAIPWQDVLDAFEDPTVGFFRLYGVYKGDGVHPCGNVNLLTKKPVKWKRPPQSPVERGRIHWGAPPSIVRTGDLLRIHRNSFDDHGAMRFSYNMGRDTVRVIENVFVHIGDVSTPDTVK